MEIVYQILGEILSQILKHFTRLTIQFRCQWLWFVNGIIKEAYWWHIFDLDKIRLVRGALTFDTLWKSRDEFARLPRSLLHLSARHQDTHESILSQDLRFATARCSFWRDAIDSTLLIGLRVLPIEKHLAKLC